MYEIRLCKTEELDLLIGFLRNSWHEDHIFVKNKEVLNFQHEILDGYNFVVAYHYETNCFHGVLGIISPNFYTDRKIGKDQHIWLVIWKVHKEIAKSNSLGVDMLDYVENEFSPKSISAIGINNNVALIYKLMGFQTKTMTHWFLPNKDIIEPKLLVGVLSDARCQTVYPSNSVIECGIDQENEIKEFLLKSKARRNFTYIVERYLNHPSYNYLINAFKKEDSAIYAISVGRKVSGNGANAFRLTELFYDLDYSWNLGCALNALMAQNGYEYIDFLEFGFDSNSLNSVGFIKCTDQFFVPHLFEPFVAERKEVKIAFKSIEPFICTKGDSDLDRPNQD